MTAQEADTLNLVPEVVRYVLRSKESEMARVSRSPPVGIFLSEVLAWDRAIKKSLLPSLSMSPKHKTCASGTWSELTPARCCPALEGPTPRLTTMWSSGEAERAQLSNQLPYGHVPPY